MKFLLRIMRRWCLHPRTHRDLMDGECGSWSMEWCFDCGAIRCSDHMKWEWEWDQDRFEIGEDA